MIRAPLTALIAGLLTLACASGPAPSAPAPPAHDEEPPAPQRAPVPAAEPLGAEVLYDVDAPKNVVDLFMALPQEHLPERLFGEDRTARERFLRTTDEDPQPASYRMHRTVLDLPNGYLEFFQDGDGDSDRIAFAYFKLPGGHKLLAQTRTGGPMCGEVSSITLTRLADGVWTDLTADAWPALDWSAFVDGDTSDLAGSPDVQVLLPREGREVRVLLSDCALMEGLEEQPERISRREVRLHLDGERFAR